MKNSVAQAASNVSTFVAIVIFLMVALFNLNAYAFEFNNCPGVKAGQFLPESSVTAGQFLPEESVTAGQFLPDAGTKAGYFME